VGDACGPKDIVRTILSIVLALAIAPCAHAQRRGAARAGFAARRGWIVTRARGLATEIKETAHDLVLGNDWKWRALMLAQIGASIADAKTSLDNSCICPACQESGPAALLVGRHPDAHNYLLAGILEVTAIAVTSHFAREHSPHAARWTRDVWLALPAASLYVHSHSALQNSHLKVACWQSGLGCS